MIGSSGAGKSTLVNRLYGKAVQAAGSVSEHVGKGKHTTTSRD
jgi:ribosome biogenesis GTPase